MPRGTCTPARQQPGISACDMRMRMSASAAGEGIWSACDMHMRMDARGRGHHCQQLGEGIWSACDMHMRMDALRDGAASAARGGHLSAR